jgi:hypothetical protein
MLPFAVVADTAMSAELLDEGSELAEAISLHEGRSFYTERPEAEEVFVGWLRETPVVTGPDTRDLPLHLELEGESLPIYALADAAERLRSLLDSRVRRVGKRVDLRHEGDGIELWPSSAAEIVE